MALEPSPLSREERRTYDWRSRLRDTLGQLEDLCRYKQAPRERRDLRMARRAIRRVLKMDENAPMPEMTEEKC